MKILSALFCCGFALFYLAGPVTAQNPVAAKEKQQEAAADTTGRVYELLADFAVNRDSLRKQRYAFVAKGTRLQDKKDAFDQSTVYWIGAQESMVKRLDANCYTAPAANNVLLERWQQRIIDGGKYYLRDTPYTDRAALEFKDKDEYEEKGRGRLIPMDPISQSLSPAVYLRMEVDPGDVIGMIVEKSELKNAKYTKEGDILATFDFSGRMKYEVTFTKKSGFMPGVVKHTAIRGERVFPISDVRTQWKQVGKLKLPGEMVASSFHMNGHTTIFELAFQWRVGRSIPNKPLVDSSLDDWREPIRVLFGQDWQRTSVRPPSLATLDLEE